jgi:hypothetical protein
VRSCILCSLPPGQFSNSAAGPEPKDIGKLTVRTSDAGTVTIARDSIQSVRSKEEEDAYQLQLNRLRNPGLGDLWSGILDTALSLSRGNSDTAAYTVGFNAARTTTRDKVSDILLSTGLRLTFGR